MQTQILFQAKKDSPKLQFIRRPILDVGHVDKMIFVALEGGMTSGEPSVLMVVEDGGGSVIMQTSLDKFMSAASALAAGCEAQWGWKRPEGYAALMPPPKEERKKLLEAIEKELREWDDAEEAADDLFKEGG